MVLLILFAIVLSCTLLNLFGDLKAVSLKSPFNGLVEFRFDFGMESEHLKARKNEDKEATITKIKSMRLAGYTLKKIATELGMTIPTVERWSKL